jgi:hypothetical protein
VRCCCLPKRIHKPTLLRCASGSLKASALRSQSSPAGNQGTGSTLKIIIASRWKPLKALLAGAALIATLISPALADYYIVQDSGTKHCTIVEERPAPGAGIIIGDRGFGVSLEAERHMTTVEVCRDATTGERGGVRIEERREH